ncbi:efflux transporter outer membrane subunit [uncultured Sphingomonas sp.]|uniref:efflux transporter outer membrane subunit n=1 Tax=uncultured Sphingomonas sp. TaxID=158754 RepID=UPI00261288C6|nr:efflux transporter outer membrane subunit [uncultured Sphingomonas sp.]
MRRAILLAAGASLSACSMAPKYVRPEAPVPASWPIGDAYLRQSEASLPSVTYRDIFRDPRLQRIIGQALANNRDLRIAAANIEAARAQYRIQRGELFPTIGASGAYGYSHRNTPIATGTANTESLSTSIGVTAFELDLFGRVRSLTSAALNRYFAQEATARATRLTLVGDVAGAWLSYAADRSLLAIAEETAANARRSVSLTDARLKGGVAPRTDLRQAEQVLASAEADLAAQKTALAQDVNALQLLIGAPVDLVLLPASVDEAGAAIAELPAGLDSSVLLRRPDVVSAEYALRAANAQIGAARAQLFPKISLTGLLGFASGALNSLFDGGAFNYSGTANAAYPIFSGGAGSAAVAQSQTQRDAALATYEKAIQTAFRDVANALARRGTIADELAANQRNADAALDNYQLADARYRGEIDTFLATLVAQRSLYSAQRGLVQTKLTRATNLVTLYRALGGDSLLDAGPAGPELAKTP